MEIDLASNPGIVVSSKSCAQSTISANALPGILGYFQDITIYSNVDRLLYFGTVSAVLYRSASVSYPAYVILSTLLFPTWRHPRGPTGDTPSPCVYERLEIPSRLRDLASTRGAGRCRNDLPGTRCNPHESLRAPNLIAWSSRGGMLFEMSGMGDFTILDVLCSDHYQPSESTLRCLHFDPASAVFKRTERDYRINSLLCIISTMH